MTESRRQIEELLAQQAATAEILRAIASLPAVLQPVLDAIARNAAILCDSLYANVFRYDGEFVHFVANFGWPEHLMPNIQRAFPARPHPSRVAGRTILAGGIVRVEDVQSDPQYDRAMAREMGDYRKILGVPMLRDGVPIGAIVVSWGRPGPIDKRHEDILTTFADQAVIAIENVRLFNELQEKRRELELANTFKSRFLSAASHDLRQPLHALNLFVAQLRANGNAAERDRLVSQVDSALGAMNELFGALLDVSKLDAGVLEASPGEFPVADLLERIETTFAGVAREKGLRFAVVPCGAWVRSDFFLLERIVGNLVSNAVRHTASGGVVVGCRYRGERLCLEVWDSGPGIAEDQRLKIFREFYQVDPPATRRSTGLGLGLAIVERLGSLLGHAVELKSVVGKGSRFSVTVPRLPAGRRPTAVEAHRPAGDPGGKVVVVIDDDALVLDAMRGILESWGCRVVAGKSVAMVLRELRDARQRPDLVISDYRLSAEHTGIQAIASLRKEFGGGVPAFLISGDTAPERLREASASDFHLLHKPVPPMALRAMVGRLLSRGAA